MNNPFTIQRELRYGAPVCDEILPGRYFTIGYSWYFRQAKWVLEIINREATLVSNIPRMNNFRSDVRMPRRFRAALDAYEGSGYDRGHLVGSANQNEVAIQNSETFLLSNMSPQVPGFNRGIWRRLEEAVRRLDAKEEILETYVLTAPIFDFGKPIEVIGAARGYRGINIPVPHAFAKSVLAEDDKGRLKLWTFLMNNEDLEGDLSNYLENTYKVEQMLGGRLWDRVDGSDLHEQKKTPNDLWDMD